MMRSRGKISTGIALTVLLPWQIVLSAHDALAQLRYDAEYPAIAYSTAVTSDPVSRLMREIDAGEVTLEHREGGGYLMSVLDVLGIDPSSQLLVFSKTARQSRFVSPDTPRALYFNDEAYVAFVPGSPSLEFAAMDPDIGPVFFELPQNPAIDAGLTRRLGSCIRCHDTLSNTGGGYPRFFTNSVIVDTLGEIASHEAGGITSPATPLNRRWGGWYVTGTHGDQAHMGNLIFNGQTPITEDSLLSNGNRTDLAELVDTSAYPTPFSDIVALLVLEHQIEVQNQITRVNYDVRTIMDAEGDISQERVEEIAGPLLLALFMAREVALSDPVEGVSGYAGWFESRGPFDNAGRTLREFDLKERTFRYPLSYLIYSPAFNALPEPVLRYLSHGITAVLTGEDNSADFAHLNSETRAAILEIVADTKPELLSGYSQDLPNDS